MRVFNGFDNLPQFKRPVVTVGSYDGVHKGHMILLGKVLELARESAGESVVISFSPHPREVLDPGGVRLLTTPDEKSQLLEAAGIDNLIIIPFDAGFSRTSYRDFVKNYLVDRVGIAHFVGGYNHHFGAGKEGGPDSMETMAGEFGFGFHPVARQLVEGVKVSSTVIRREIESGNMSATTRLLGHNYFAICALGYSGTLICGSSSKLLPPSGVYTVAVNAACEEFTDELVVTRQGGIFLSACADRKIHSAVPSGSKVRVEFL